MKQLTNENYFDLEMQKKYFGVSQFKSFEKCEAAALAEVTGNYERERTTALLVGSYVDAHFEGTLDIFKAKNPEVFTKKGELRSEYKQAEVVINRLERDPLFMFYMNGEKQVIMTGEIEGVPVKIKIDSYHPGKMIVDLKVMKDFQDIYVEGKGRLNWIEAWSYDIQGAVYQEIVRQNTGLKLPFFIAAATKEKEPDIDIVEIPQPFLDVALEHFKESIMRYDGIKDGIFEPVRCEKCDYCKMTKVLREPRKLEVLN